MNRRLLRWNWLWAMGIGLLVGCSAGPDARAVASPSPAPTPTAAFAFPTMAASTATFTPSPTPSATPRPLETVVQGVQVTPFTVMWPTATFTPAPVPTLAEPAYAAVHIFTPGPGSKVVAPLHVRFQVRVNRVRIMHIELLGEDGRLLFRQTERFRRGAAGWRGYALDIPFEIRAESEWGRLQVVLQDNQNRPLFQQAVPLVLLRQGRADLIPQEVWASPIIIQEPRWGARVTGGELTVRGFAIPTTGLVDILVLGDDGRVWFARSTSVSEPNPQGYGVFQVTIPYQVEEDHQVQIVVQAYGDRVPGVMYLNRTEAWLAP